MALYMDINNVIAEGEEITIVSQGSFGGMWVRHSRFLGADPKPHYANCPVGMIGTVMTHKPKGKRSVYKTVFDFNTPVVIYRGWVDIDVEKLVYNTYRQDGVIIRESKYTAFDDTPFSDLIHAHPDYLIKDNVEYKF